MNRNTRNAIVIIIGGLLSVGSGCAHSLRITDPEELEFLGSDPIVRVVRKSG